MKKILLNCFILLSLGGYSQITFDFQSQHFWLYPIKLTDSETKYLDNANVTISNQNQFSLYNLDGTLYKTISLPPKPAPSASINVLSSFSRTLFDNDPSNIEFLVEYSYDSINWTYRRTKIIREDGTILFDEMNAAESNIYSTEDGTKLMLKYAFANGPYYNLKVFNLPGMIPTAIEDKNLISNQPLSLYPNPNNGSFFVQIHSKEGKENIIDLFSSTGNLIGTYKSSNETIQINTLGLPEGLYYLNNRGGNTGTKMIIKK